MPCNLVMFVIMDTLQNIDFSVLRMRLSEETRFKYLCSYHWPIGSYGPKSRPDSFNSGIVRWYFNQTRMGMGNVPHPQGAVFKSNMNSPPLYDV